MKLDEDGNPTIDMELVELNEITRASRCSKASWIGAVNLLEAAAADYQRRREVHCGYYKKLYIYIYIYIKNHWRGGWTYAVPGSVCYSLNKESGMEKQSSTNGGLSFSMQGMHLKAITSSRERLEDMQGALQRPGQNVMSENTL